MPRCRPDGLGTKAATIVGGGGDGHIRFLLAVAGPPDGSVVEDLVGGPGQRAGQPTFQVRWFQVDQKSA